MQQAQRTAEAVDAPSGSPEPIPGAGVSLRGVSLDIKGKRILDDVTFEARPGAVTALVAPNGGGKTTTFRTIAGMMVPTAGEILVGGARQVPGKGRVPVSISSADRIAWPDRRPRTVLLDHAALYGLGRAEARSAVDALVRELGMEGIADRPWGRLSTGEAAKVTFARTLLPKVGTYVFDEPTAGLDAVSARAMRVRIEALRNAGHCILMASHRTDEVAGISDTVVVMNAGRIVDVVDAAALRLKSGLGAAIAHWGERAEGGWS